MRRLKGKKWEAYEASLEKRLSLRVVSKERKVARKRGRNRDGPRKRPPIQGKYHYTDNTKKKLGKGTTMMRPEGKMEGVEESNVRLKTAPVLKERKTQAAL